MSLTTEKLTAIATAVRDEIRTAQCIADSCFGGGSRENVDLVLKIYDRLVYEKRILVYEKRIRVAEACLASAFQPKRSES